MIYEVIGAVDMAGCIAVTVLEVRDHWRSFPTIHRCVVGART